MAARRAKWMAEGKGYDEEMGENRLPSLWLFHPCSSGLMQHILSDVPLVVISQPSFIFPLFRFNVKK